MLTILIFYVVAALGSPKPYYIAKAATIHKVELHYNIIMYSNYIKPVVSMQSQ